METTATTDWLTQYSKVVARSPTVWSIFLNCPVKRGAITEASIVKTSSYVWSHCADAERSSRGKDHTSIGKKCHLVHLQSRLRNPPGKYRCREKSSVWKVQGIFNLLLNGCWKNYVARWKIERRTKLYFNNYFILESCMLWKENRWNLLTFWTIIIRIKRRWVPNVARAWNQFHCCLEGKK